MAEDEIISTDDGPRIGVNAASEPVVGKKAPPGKGRGSAKAPQKKSLPKAPIPRVIEVAPVVGPAKMRKRHWGGILSFFALVVAPLILVAWYLAAVAINQYTSVAGFTVRQNEGASATDLLGGFSSLVGGGGGSSDTDILYKFIQSPALVNILNDKLDISDHYSAPSKIDPIFSLRMNASAEDLVNYWPRVAIISYEQSSGLIELQVRAFDPQTAQTIVRNIMDESQKLINNLNAQSRQDIIEYAEADLDLAQDRLKAAQERLTLFRTRTQIVDPTIDLQGRLGVLNNLQQQLADALIEMDILSDGTSSTDPRLDQAARRITVIRNRIVQERQNVASESVGVDGIDYPVLIAEYENLLINREFSATSYSAALAALESARADASRQNRYLAVYEEPTLAESSEYPRRWVIFGLIALFTFLIWSILVLVFYSIRDSR